MPILTKRIWLFLTLLLTLSGALPVSAQIPDKGSVIEVTLTAPAYRVLQSEADAVSIELDGFDTARIPGYPALPVRIVDVALPPGAEATAFAFVDAATESLGLDWNLSCVPAQTSDDGMTLEFALDRPFPDAAVEIEGTHALGGIMFARLRFYPFQYNPATGELRFTSQVKVGLRYERGPESPLPARIGDLRTLFLENTEQAQEWYPAGVQAQAAEGYLILTTDEMASVSAVQTFAAHKSELGFEVHVAKSADWAGYPGAEPADKIRNYLINRYGPWNLRWLLIIGSGSSIPMKTVYPCASDHGSSWPTPTDAYYADLSGNWDADRDGFFGEMGEDAADFVSELNVGRIPFDDPAIVGPILQKTATFETTDGEWRRKALLAMAVQGYWPTGEIQTDGAYLGEQMQARYLNAAGFVSTRLYEGTPPGTAFPYDQPITLANVTSTWSNGYGLVVWWGHGNRYGAYRRLWNGGSQVDTPFITYSDLASLSNAHPSIVFANSCLNAQPENTNLASELLKQGAVVSVAGTRITWYYLVWDAYNDGGNATMAFLFGENLVKDKEPAGAAFADAKAAYASGNVWTNGDQQNLVSFNLYGDPSVGLWTAASILGQPLSVGWNLIAFSNLSSSVPVQDAFASVNGSYQEVYTYEPLAGANPWLHYVAGGPQDDNTLTEVSGDLGYWVRATEPCTLTIASVPSSAPAIALHEGWNLVAFPKMTPESVPDALASIADKVVQVFAHDPEGATEWRRYNPSAPSWANQLTTFHPGEGYWIKVSADAVWSP